MGRPTTAKRLKTKTLVMPVVPPKRCHCIMLFNFYSNDEKCSCCINAMQLEVLKKGDLDGKPNNPFFREAAHG